MTFRPKLTDGQRSQVEESLTRTAGANGGPSKTASIIPHHRVVLAAKMVDETGVVEAVEAWKAEDRVRHRKHAGGRQSKVSSRQALILYKILALDGKPSNPKGAADLILYRLSTKSLKLLDLDPSSGTHDQWRDRIWYTIDRFLKPMDPKRLDPSVGGDRRKGQARWRHEEMSALIDSEEDELRMDRLHWAMNQLLGSTHNLVPAYLRDNWNGDVGIDATLTEFEVHHGSRMRDKTPDDIMAIIPSGNYYKGTLLWGGDLHLGTALPNTAYANDEFPRIIVAASFAPCATNPGLMATRILTSLHERQMGRPDKVKHVPVDLAYFPTPKPEHFQLPARKMGYAPTGVFSKKQMGIHGGYAGLIQVEDDFYCPFTPKALLEASIDRWVNGTIDHETWLQRKAQAQKFAIWDKERPRPDGSRRGGCPAIGANPTVTCSNCPGSAPPNSSALPHIEAPEMLPCCGKTTVIPGEVAVRFSQPLKWGTQEHAEKFRSGRSTNEAVNGLMKRDSEFGLADPGRRKLRGFAGQFFQATLTAVSYNVHRIDTHLRAIRDGNVPDPHPERNNTWEIIEDAIRHEPEPVEPDANAPPIAA